ncbi:MAG: TIGR00366 family protein [Clostridia bacterium]|nr:TIGR00366 family protein [Clostridia bacterium]
METQNKEKSGLNINVRSFIIALAVIFGLMVASYVLTFAIPGGQYERIETAEGNLVVNPDHYETVEGGLPFWKWLLSPILVLTADGSAMLIAVIAFLLVIGGAFNALGECGLMRYLLDSVTAKFGRSRYRLMAALVLLFMAMGSLIGSFEECVPLVPIVVALAIALGWDAVTGLGMSLLAAGCGFAAGVCNPFTVGVAQKQVGLPMFSGAWLRAIAFALIYILLFTFLRYHAKKVERPADQLAVTFTPDKRMSAGLITFVSILGGGIAVVFSSAFIPALQDYTMIIVAVMFLVAGITSCLVSGMKTGALARSFGGGVLSILPAVLMILMASSIKFILEEASILDTILHAAIGTAQDLPKWVVILFIYLLVLVMNFFVASGSAKAFMIIPLIKPLAEVLGISLQLCVMAYAFGDGFSNVFYPTNAALLIALNLAGIGYGDWVKWSFKFQLANLILTSGILLLGLAVGYC